MWFPVVLIYFYSVYGDPFSIHGLHSCVRRIQEILHDSKLVIVVGSLIVLDLVIDLLRLEMKVRPINLVFGTECSILCVHLDMGRRTFRQSCAFLKFRVDVHLVR